MARSTSRAGSRRILALLIVLASLALAPARVQAALSAAYSAQGGFDVAPGVAHEHGTVAVNQDAVRNVNIVTVAADHPGIGIRLSQAAGIASQRETVVDQALAYSQEGRRVVATVNGSLFGYLYGGTSDHGLGLGFNVSDGELVNAGRLGRGPAAAFAITADGQPIIGLPEPVVTLTLPSGDGVTIDRVNQRRQPGGSVLYTPLMGTRTWTDAMGDEYVIEGFDLPLRPAGSYSGTVVALRDGMGDTEIGPGQVVLSVSDTAPAWPAPLAVGDPISVSIAVSEPWASVAQSVGGRDLLVVDGQSVVPQPDEDGAHARTAVGIRDNGEIFFVTVANDDLTNGLTLTDTAQLMLSLGAVDALNLDGGGSTQMAVRQPGDIEVSATTPPTAMQVYRPVVNAVQIVSSLPTGPLADLVLAPRTAEVATGAPIEFTAKGIDAAHNGVPADPEPLNWSIAPVAGGSMGEPASRPTPTSAVFIVDEPGDHVVTVEAGSMSATASLTVADDIVPPQITGLAVSLPPSGTVGLDQAGLSIAWSGHDDRSIAAFELQLRRGTDPWQSIALEPAAVAATVAVGYGEIFRLRVRAIDGAGNVGAWLTSVRYRLRILNDTNARIELSEGWKRRYSDAAIKGQFVRTRALGASAQATYTGLQVALIGNRGPTLGQADLAIDGVSSGTINANAETQAFRQLLFVSEPVDLPAPGTISVTNSSQPAGGGFELDAVLVLTVDS